jgi:non-heme chloroperoxidase
MSMIQVNQAANGEPVELYYEDIGSGSPVILIHGWPLTHAMWEYQFLPLTHNGYRVISYDRRGFGLSDKPADGYDYDTLADDLKGLIDGLELDNVTLVGFSMGGGEVARYMSRHGGHQVARTALISSVTPMMLKGQDNEDGVDKDVFAKMYEQLQQDRFKFLTSFGKQFFGESKMHNAVSSETLTWAQMLASMASPIATLKCLESFSMTDFRVDLGAIQVPTLVIHGKADKAVPFDASGKRTAEMLPFAESKVYDDGPHALVITHKDQFNTDLLGFLRNTESQAITRQSQTIRPSAGGLNTARH